MVQNKAIQKARVRTHALIQSPGCPWPGVWLRPASFGAEGSEDSGMPGIGEWSAIELRRALVIAVAMALAGLLLGALLAALVGRADTDSRSGGLPGPVRLPLPERPSPGYPAPGIDGRTLDGERLCLRDCAGEVVLLTFFNTASGASLAHMSVLAQIHAEGQESESREARIVAIAVGDKPDAVLRYMETRKLDLPVIADPRGELARLYEITAVPTTFVVDAQGIVQDLRVGAMTRTQLERAVRSVL